MAMHFDVGDLARSRVAFYNLAGQLTDPTTIVSKYEKPDGTEVTVTYPDASITKESTGRYYRDIDLTAAGNWHHRWNGTGAVQAAAEELFIVDATVF